MQRVFKAIFDFLASYLFAVVLLGFLFLLTLLGTLEQVDHGLYEVQRKYFNSLFLIHQVGDGELGLPLPGAALVLALLTINLILGGLVRIRKTRETAGIIIAHIGIVLMMLAGLVKLQWSDEGHLTLFEGERSDEYVSYYTWEIAIFRADEAEDVTELVIPHEALVDIGGGGAYGDGGLGASLRDVFGSPPPDERRFTHPDLPFALTVSRFSKNCRVMPKGPMWDTPHPVIEGYAMLEQPLEENAEYNVAGCYVTLEEPGREPTEGILWGNERYPLVYEAEDGERWAVSMRHTRFPMPFAIELDDFTRELHPRTGIAKSFMSDVTKVDDDTGKERGLRIEMNEPLRDGGLVLFQASWGPSNAREGDPLFSTFAVVRNPSDQWPLYSLLVMGAGLALAFGQKLVRHVRSAGSRRRKQAAAPAAELQGNTAA